MTQGHYLISELSGTLSFSTRCPSSGFLFETVFKSHLLGSWLRAWSRGFTLKYSPSPTRNYAAVGDMQVAVMCSSCWFAVSVSFTPLCVLCVARGKTEERENKAEELCGLDLLGKNKFLPLGPQHLEFAPGWMMIWSPGVSFWANPWTFLGLTSLHLENGSHSLFCLGSYYECKSVCSAVSPALEFWNWSW